MLLKQIVSQCCMWLFVGIQEKKFVDGSTGVHSFELIVLFISMFKKPNNCIIVLLGKIKYSGSWQLVVEKTIKDICKKKILIDLF